MSERVEIPPDAVKMIISILENGNNAIIRRRGGGVVIEEEKRKTVYNPLANRR